MAAFLLPFHGNVGAWLNSNSQRCSGLLLQPFLQESYESKLDLYNHMALSITSTYLKILLDILQRMFIHWKKHKQLSCQKGFIETILNTHTSAFHIKLI